MTVSGPYVAITHEPYWDGEEQVYTWTVVRAATMADALDALDVAGVDTAGWRAFGRYHSGITLTPVGATGYVAERRVSVDC